MGRIRDLVRYVGSLARGDIWFPIDGDTLPRGQRISGQQVYELCKGEDGKNISLRRNETHLQWQRDGDAAWMNLVLLSDLKGADGKELEVRVEGGCIQSRLAGGTWENLVAIDDLKGDTGASAYEFWLAAGNTGTESDFLLSLKGENGESNYQLWLDAGNVGDVMDYLNSLKGDVGNNGRSLIVFSSGPSEGNIGYWDDAQQMYVDSGVPASVVGSIDGTAVAFTAATSLADIVTGDSIAVLFGKIKKWYTDAISKLKALAFKDKVDWLTDVDNRPTIPSNTSDLVNDSNYLAKSSVVDDTSSTLTDVPLSANQGRGLRVLVDGINQALPILISTHNTASNSHPDIRQAIADAEAIAKGKARARVFDTVALLDAWLLVPANVAELQVGDNFYIRATDVPDYWWDGSVKRVLESEKVDLTDYYTKAAADGKFATLAGLGNFYNKTESDDKYVAQVQGKDLSTNDLTDDYEAQLDFNGEQTVNSLSNLVVTKKCVFISTNVAQTLSISSVAVKNEAFVIAVIATAAMVVNIPSSAGYVNLSGKASINIASGKMSIIHVWQRSNGDFIINVEEGK